MAQGAAARPDPRRAGARQVAFGEIMPALSGNREVITVDLQGHGRTADIDRPMSFKASADDIVALMRYLKIEKADVMGYSAWRRRGSAHRNRASRMPSEN